jgi:hypothetical protein
LSGWEIFRIGENMANNKLASYINNNGLRINFTWERLVDTISGECFVYGIIAQIENIDKRHIFKVFIQKSVINRVDLAEKYLDGLPLEEIKKRLANATVDNIPLCLNLEFDNGFAIV